MTPPYYEIVTVLIALSGLILTLAMALFRHAGRLASLEVKVDTMWTFQLRRGISESLQQGVFTKNSPLQITDHARVWMSSLVIDLQNTYRDKRWTKLRDPDLAEIIEREFGERLLHEVCIPRSLSMGACLIMAMKIAREAEEKK